MATANSNKTASDHNPGKSDAGTRTDDDTSNTNPTLDNRTVSDGPGDNKELTRVGYNGIVNPEIPSHADNEVSQIFYRNPVDGKEHGPMPLADWDDYARKNGL